PGGLRGTGQPRYAGGCLHVTRPFRPTTRGAQHRVARRAGGLPLSRRRPGRLWLFFYGRKRRGFPGLLVGVVAAALLLGLVYGVPGGADLSRWFIVVTLVALVALILGSLALVAVAALRRQPRGRRPGRR